MKKNSLITILCLASLCVSGQQVETPSSLASMDSLLNNLNNFRSPDRIEKGLILVRQYKDTILAYGDSISLQYAHALMREAEFETMKGQLSKGIPLYLACISILTTINNTESTAYIRATYLLGQNLLLLGDFLEAEKWLKQSMLIQEKKSGKENTSYVNSLQLLGKLKTFTSDYHEAEILLTEAMTISILLNGKDSKQTSSVHSGLAILFVESGEPEKALPHFLENLRISELNYNKEDDGYLVPLMQVGICYMYLDMPGLSEEYLLKCEKGYQIRGVNTLSQLALGNYMSVLHSLSNTYETMGKYEKALPVIMKVDSFCHTLSGNFAVCRGAGLSKGNILSNLGLKAEAENAYLEYKAYILDETGRTDNPQYGKALANLGSGYYEEASYEKAKPMLEEACGIFANLYGKANEKYLSTLWKLGMIQFYTGDTLGATGVMEYIEKTTRDSIHNESTDFYALINALTKFYHIKQDSGAASYYLELMHLLPTQYHHITQLYSEREFLAHDHKYVSDVHRFQSYLLDHPREQSLYALAYDVSLLTKSFFLDYRLKLQAQIHQTDSSTQAQYTVWKKKQLQLFKAYAERVPDSLHIANLEISLDSSEVNLRKKLPGISALKTNITWREIASALSPDEVAIEISRIPYFHQEPTHRVYYSASIILPGNSTPVFIPLCEETELASLLSYTPDHKKTNINSLYTYAFNGKALYTLIWAPIQAYLKDTKRIYLSPDGLFHRIQMAAVPVNEKQIIDDVYDISILTSTRALANPNRVSNIPSVHGITATIFGGLIYDEAPSSTSAHITGNTQQVRGETDDLETDTTLRKSPWSYLPFSAIEADDIHDQLTKHGVPVKLYSGVDGTEFTLKEEGRSVPEHSSSNILHLSTHGFFFPRYTPSNSTDQSNDTYVFKLSNHSMLRCGLLFSGVNPYWIQAKMPNSPNEGILTGYEISQLNLAQTDLVVLSACETGLGDIRGSEGVYGLQRAFKIAGAKQIISSLWQVPDYQTYELMDLFYKGYLEEKLSAREALQYARDKMRKKRYEPFYWAGFVLLE